MAALAPRAGADLDIDVPPGMPLEWPLPRPGRALKGRPDITGAPAERPPRPAGSVEPAIPERDPGGEYAELDCSVEPTVAVDFRGITTADITFHLPWAATPNPPAFAWMVRPEHAARLGWRFPPDRSPRLRWLCVATLLRVPMHPQVVTPVATAEQLIEIGEVAREVAAGAQGGPADEVAQLVVRGVGAPSPVPPALDTAGMSPYRSMVERFALCELAATHPHDPELPFAPRLLALGAEAIAPLVRLAGHAHPLVRANAASGLARFDDPRARAQLVALIALPDRVARNRAIAALSRARARDAVPALLALLGPTNDPGSRVVAAHALGLIGDPAAFGPLKGYLLASLGDVDAMWAAIPALVRMPIADGEVRLALASLEARLRADRDQMSVPRLLTPLAAHKVTRAEITAEMCLLWRAVHGDDASRAELFELLRKARQRAGDPDARALGPPRQRGRELYGLTLPNLFLGIDALARLGAPGTAVLRDVVVSKDEALAVRAYALERMDLAAAMTYLEAQDELAKLAKELDSGPLAGVALRLLADADPVRATTAALELVARYAKYDADLREVAASWRLVPALGLVGKGAGPERIALLTQVLERAREERRLADKKRQQAAEHHDSLGPTGNPIGTVPPVLEAAIAALARTGNPAVVPALVEQLRDGARPARAEAALGLGLVGGREAAFALADGLADQDPWVRFCAHRALARVLERAAPEADVDWLAAPIPDIARAAKRWRDAVASWAGR